MENRLTQAQLFQVVADLERLAQRREAELDQEQVKEILQELNLPGNLLEDALVQLRRREELARQQRKKQLIVAVVVALLGGAIATTTFLHHRHQQAIASIATIESRITLDRDNSRLGQINRQTSPIVYYQVTLKDTPVGNRLSLTCDWVNPSGEVVHQSNYQTRQIERSVWTTYCYHQLSPSATTGTWEVRMFLEGLTVVSNWLQRRLIECNQH